MAPPQGGRFRFSNLLASFDFPYGAKHTNDYDTHYTIFPLCLFRMVFIIYASHYINGSISLVMLLYNCIVKMEITLIYNTTKEANKYYIFISIQHVTQKYFYGIYYFSKIIAMYLCGFKRSQKE